MVLTPLERLNLALQDRYRIERMLGQGGMAMVFAATDLRQPRSVAIKLLRPELAALIGPDRFLREISISAQLNHPHILPLFESGEADGLPWFAMPLVAGESLRDRLVRERQLPVEEALRITHEVGDALGYAHAQGIIHRDIKPENILLSRGHALVADFGIGRALDAAGGDRLTETGLAVGTPSYMSPEQASGTEGLDARSDLYSLACVLYEMLAGTPPFSAPTAQGVLARHLMDSVPPIRTVRNTVPPHVEAAILAGMAKAKADRFASVVEFIEAIDGKRPSPSLPYPIVQPARRRRHWVMAGAGFLAVALGAWALWREEPAYVSNRVLVMPFETPNGDSSLRQFGYQMATTLADAIGREGVGDPVPAATVQALQISEGEGSVDVTARLARATGAGLVLRGTCVPSARRTNCQIELVRMPGGIPRLAVNVVGDPAEPDFTAELTERAAVILLLQQRWGDRTTWRGEYVPRSLEAVRDFLQGWDLLAMRDTGSARHFERAYTLDTAWVLAGLWHSEALPPSLRDSTLEWLSRRPGLRAGDREAIAEFQAYWRRDWPRAYELASRRFLAQPEIWLGDAVLFAYYADRPVAALRHFQIADSVSTAWVWVFSHAAYALHHLGRYHEEIQLAARMRERFPEKPINYRTVEIMGRAGAGDIEGVKRVVAEAEATPELTEDWGGARAVVAAQELIAHGQEAEGMRMLAATLPRIQKLAEGNGMRPGPARDMEPGILLQLGRLEEAQKLAVERLRGQKTAGDSVGLLSAIGLVEARRGRREHALQVSRQLAELDPRVGHGAVPYFQAGIAAVLGDREGAVRLLEVARARGSDVMRHGGLHRDHTFASLRGYPPFDQLLRPKG